MRQTRSAQAFLDAAARLAESRGMTRKELLRSMSAREVAQAIRDELGESFQVRMQASFSIDPAILEAGDVVAAHLGIPRKEVFRSMRTADVLAEAERLRA